MKDYKAIALEKAEQIDKEFYQLYGAEESNYDIIDVELLTRKIAQLILDGVRPREELPTHMMVRVLQHTISTKEEIKELTARVEALEKRE